MSDAPTVTTVSEWHQTECTCASATAGWKSASEPTAEARTDPRDSPSGVEGVHLREGMRLDYYQNGRVNGCWPLAPTAGRHLRRDRWDTAISEVAGVGCRADEYGGEAIFRTEAVGRATISWLLWSGDARRARLQVQANAISQEKTGEMLVMGRISDSLARRLRALRGGVLRRQEPVDIPRHPHARTTLKPSPPTGPGMIVSSASHGDRSDGRLPPPGPARARAWLIAAMAAVLATRGSSIAHGWRARQRVDEVRRDARGAITEFCEISGIDEDLVRGARDGSPPRRASPRSRILACR